MSELGKLPNPNQERNLLLQQLNMLIASLNIEIAETDDTGKTQRLTNLRTQAETLRDSNQPVQGLATKIQKLQDILNSI